ncbi:hypothetical protein PHJA_000523500 [Phtheirospermum japonicum]|uniref:Uncharacterized protein n=1 Tax=Phtheirospermum japonicum TaxID=374723 RepID=A0A830B7Y4_9LAMI|nr:hypothetical protein PHJA_000523500 [Phtheirospermum japonicum]
MERLSVAVPEEIILADLADENVRVIGICTFPGIIGTRLATRVGEKAMKRKLISGVLMATADELLQSRLMMEKGILIIGSFSSPTRGNRGDNLPNDINEKV